jgi:hypothetical protein
MTNEYPKPENDDTPNYYGGGLPNPAPQPSADPYNNPYAQPAQQPYAQQAPYSAPQQFNAYGNQNPYQQPVGYGMAPTSAPTNKNALISLITSLATLFILCGIPVVGTIAAIVGIVFGHKALKETTNDPNSGRGMALAGVICGYASLAMSLIIGGLLVLIFIGAAVSGTSGY